MILANYVEKKYLEKNKKAELKAQFSKAKPFPYLELKKFLTKDASKKLLEAVLREQFTPKEADLFSLKHTNDIISSKNKELVAFRDFLLSEEFMQYMESITNLKLKRKAIDLAGSLYEDTDYLLCHDDQLEGRKIAFLFYLSDMKQSDGGSLGLIDKQLKTKQRIVPRMGTLAFFEVSPISYHEVEEVVVKKQRLALGGWFHG
jgi:prolyl 3-hydroxylase /prolyl 3,4-dihydroxylase